MFQNATNRNVAFRIINENALVRRHASCENIFKKMHGKIELVRLEGRRLYRISRDRPWPPYLDLATARDTLRGMLDDMKRVPELQDVAAAIENVLREMDKAESVNPRRIGLNILTASRFTRLRN